MKDAGCEGNVFLDKMMGASLYYVPTKAEYTTELLPRMQTLADKIRYGARTLRRSQSNSSFSLSLTEMILARIVTLWKWADPLMSVSMVTWKPFMNWSSRLN